MEDLLPREMNSTGTIVEYEGINRISTEVSDRADMVNVVKGVHRSVFCFV
jgi:hypothetical protein